MIAKKPKNKIQVNEKSIKKSLERVLDGFLDMMQRNIEDDEEYVKWRENYEELSKVAESIGLKVIEFDLRYKKIERGKY